MKATHLAALCALLPVLATAAPKTGDPAPNLASLVSGTKLPDTKGKVVLVDFWASWCVPCQASFVALNRLHQAHSAKGLVIIGLSVDDEEAKYKEFVSQKKPLFTVAHDSGHKAADLFSPPGMPSSYLIDRKGNIRFIHKGFKKATEAEYQKEIAALLAEK